MLGVLQVQQSAAFDPAAGDFAKDSASHVRVMSYNVLNNFPAGSAAEDAAFDRLLTAINPDVISFQEVASSVMEADMASRLDALLGGSWTVHNGLADGGGNRNVLAVKNLALTTTSTQTIPPFTVPLRGVTAGLVNDAFGSGNDFYVMAVHLRSGGSTSNHQERQDSADAIINWMRDARTAGGNITLAANTPMLVVGDFNLDTPDSGDVAPYHAALTIFTGDIFDTGTFGADSPPDWDGSEITDAVTYDHNTGDVHTHSSDPLLTSYIDSRFDRFYYTDSAVRVANRALVNSLTMSGAALSAAGLNTSDTVTTSDHLPSFCDFEFGAEGAPGLLVINEFSYDDVGADTRSFVEFKNVGGQLVNLEAPLNYEFLNSNNNLPDFDPGSSNQANFYNLVGIVPPGGLYVLYDGVGESSDIAATIEAALPPLQRRDLASFTLRNGPVSGIALTYRTEYVLGTEVETAADAYVYAAGAGPTYYFRTSLTNLLIPLSGDQLSTLALATDMETFSRNLNDSTPNSFAGWTNPDTATPGMPNNTVSVEMDVTAIPEMFWIYFE